MAANLPPVPPPDAGDVTAPVQRHLISAGAVIVAGGLLFGAVGLVRGGDDTPDVEIVAQPSDGAASPSPADVASTPDDVEATPEATDDATPVEQEPTPEATSEEPTPEPEPTPTPTPSPTPTPTPTPAPSPSPTPEASEDDGRIAPSSISIQILDAVLDDGDEAVDTWRAKLREDGYRVVAKNDAIRKYEKTTVMYTAGFRAQAEQIAKDYGFSAVQEKPDNLSDSVQIHLVIGDDAR